jgi:hypothetical protein
MGVTASSPFDLESISNEDICAYVSEMKGGEYAVYVPSLREMDGMNGATLKHFDNDGWDGMVDKISSSLGVKNEIHAGALLAEVFKIRELDREGEIAREGSEGGGGDGDGGEVGIFRSPSLSTAKIMECCICLEPMYKPVTLLCGHNGCKSCLEQSFLTSSSCPCCRAEVTVETRSLLSVNIALDELILKAYPDLEEYRKSLAKKAEVAEVLRELNSKDSSGHTQLMVAASTGDTARVRVLIDEGADVNIVDSVGRNALTSASWGLHIEAVRALISGGINVNTVNTLDGRTALHDHSYWGHIELVRILLAAGALPNSRDGRQCTPLYLASNQGNFEVVKMLIEAGADVNVRTTAGFTALAACSSSSPIANYLRDHGASR